MSESTPKSLNDNSISVYKEYTDKLAEIKAANLAAKFDYESPAGNKAARSHVYKLRQTKSAIEETRVAAKKDALEYGKKVDAHAKALTAEIEGMIEVHAAPLRAIEEREAKRIAAIKNNIERFNIVGADMSRHSVEDIKRAINEMQNAPIDQSYAEFQNEAQAMKDRALVFLQQAFNAAQQREELERLRNEKAAREKQEAEEKIRQDAAKQATFEAEKRAQAERDEAAKREQALKDQAAEAERKAEQAAAAERKRIQDEADRQAAEDAKRAANNAYRKAVHDNIAKFLDGYGIGDNAARCIIQDIDAGKIPALKIIY